MDIWLDALIVYSRSMRLAFAEKLHISYMVMHLKSVSVSFTTDVFEIVLLGESHSHIPAHRVIGVD